MHWRPHVPSSSSSISSHSTATSSPPLNRQTQRQLTRAKKLRHLQDDDIKDLNLDLLRSSKTPTPPSSEVNAPTTTSGYNDPPRWSVDSHASTNSKLGRVAPVALPQPLPLPALGSPHTGNTRKPVGGGDVFPLPSRKEGGHRGEKERGREREKGKAREEELERSEEALAREGVFGIPNDYPNGRTTLHQDTMSSDVPGSVDHAHLGFSRHAPRKMTLNDKAQSHISIHVPSSEPSTRYSSPAISPQRMSTGDLRSSSPYHIPQLWSAPEMPYRDMTCGYPFTPLQDRPSMGYDCSPLQSPQFSKNRPTSPIRPMLSIDTSMVRQENTRILSSGHPLPLPPGAAVLPQSSLVPQRTPKPEPFQLRGQWIKGKLIGRGTFGSVYAATNRKTGALCAMKEVELFPDDPKAVESMKQLEQEIKVLSQLKHPNIVQYYGSEMADDKFYIYLEYVYPGSICKYVREHCGAMTESVVRNFTRHILSGLAYLHSTKTIHRDIKGANLLVDAFGVVKLADFGMAKHLTGQAAELSLKGSPYWMAPELMQAVMQKDNTPDLALAVDIWSLGCTVIEMFTGKPPWHEYEGAAAMFKVMKESPPLPENLSAEGKDFLRCCFRRNPAERPTASMLLEHRFVKNSQPIDLPAYLHSPSGLSMMK